MRRSPASPGNLKRWQAALAALLGGVLAQAASLLVGAIVAAGVIYQHGTLEPRAFDQALQSLLVLTASIVAVSGTLALTAIVTPWLASAPIRQSLGLQSAPWTAYLGAALGALGLGPVSRMLLDLMRRFAQSLTFGTLDSLNDIASDHPFLLVWLLLAATPSLCEELLFRGLLQRTLGNAWWALLVSAFAFAAFHVDPHQVVATLPIGLYLAWVAARTGSTWVPVTAHLTNNTLAVVAARHFDNEQPSGAHPQVPLWTLAVSALFLTVSCVLVRRGSRGTSRAT
jgi:membrane protease YdiL (CAAX protease family)